MTGTLEHVDTVAPGRGPSSLLNVHWSWSSFDNLSSVLSVLSLVVSVGLVIARRLRAKPAPEPSFYFPEIPDTSAPTIRDALNVAFQPGELGEALRACR